MANVHTMARKLERLARELRETAQELDRIAASTNDRRALVAGGHARAACLSAERGRIAADAPR